MNIDLLWQDYRPQAPSHEVYGIDAEVAAGCMCKRCKHKGLRYQPYNKPGSYIAMAICPKCGQEEEF